VRVYTHINSCVEIIKTRLAAAAAAAVVVVVVVVVVMGRYYHLKPLRNVCNVKISLHINCSGFRTV